MSLFITSLNSGSNGNCYYIGNAEEAVLVDVGISCREVERRMRRLGLTMDKVKAIFISHEHTDHISGVPVLAKKYRLPVYITGQTLQHSRMQLSGIPFRPQEPVTIGQLQVTAFVKYHDACDPHSFLISGNGVTIGVFTDIGQCCDQLVLHFRQCHAAFLEANYDTDMLEKGRYPVFLKNRIRGGHGHLSNQQALDLFTQHKPEGMQVLLLSHLSRDNNDPTLVQEIFSRHAGAVEVAVASRYVESKVYEVFPGQLVAAPFAPMPIPIVHEMPKKKKRSAIPSAVQSTLF
ncbi:MBL fold metallo-hydrolase [Chitinophaga barathri]|uniref:MBL fold metallo-hydrolase n=1 Tax=Chitinophaga barathri TaxID=1647451 RepID=A0A3N4MCZ4_9BACT|nr:MBL fold metallo-hydrolase [Chitinophaga barathri]RPD41802.1 MBL fold metallo-hydrolase [Chitinophaga barathri]